MPNGLISARLEKFPCIFSGNRELGSGERFAPDSLHRQQVLEFLESPVGIRTLGTVRGVPRRFALGPGLTDLSKALYRLTRRTYCQTSVELSVVAIHVALGRLSKCTADRKSGTP